MGAANLAQMRSTELIACRTRPLNWVNVGLQATYAAAPSVVVLGVVASNPNPGCVTRPVTEIGCYTAASLRHTETLLRLRRW
jgi:hypothetical protein